MAEIVRMAERTVEEVADGYEIVTLAENDLMSLGHMHFEPGASIPEHSHPNQQIGMVYRGELTFHASGDQYVLEPGDSYALQGNEPHYGENHSGEPVDGFYVLSPPRGGPTWEE